MFGGIRCHSRKGASWRRALSRKRLAVDDQTRHPPGARKEGDEKGWRKKDASGKPPYGEEKRVYPASTGRATENILSIWKEFVKPGQIDP